MKSFEQKFSHLAEQTIREKAESLLKYRVGFQVLDVSEDESRAVGVYGFQLGDVFALMPIFFLRGALKGHEMIYLKNQDTIVPAEDGWINSIIRKDLDKGMRVSDGLGLDLRASNAPGDINTDFNSFQGALKTASEEENGSGIVSAEELKKMLRCPGGLDTVPLGTSLSAVGNTALQKFASTVMSSPDFANSLFRFYSPSDLKQMTSAASQVLQKKAAEEESKETSGEVIVIKDLDDPMAPSLSDSEKSVLVREGTYIKDTRKKISQIFSADLNNSNWSNPTTAGFYEVLMHDGKTKKFLVHIIHEGPKRRYAMTDMEAPKEYAVVNTQILARSLAKAPEKSFGYPPSIRSLKDVEGYYFMATQGKDRTEEFTKSGTEFLAKGCSLEGVPSPVIFTGKPGKLSTHGGAVYIPATARVFKSNARSYSFGDLRTVERLLFKEAGIEPLQIKAQKAGAEIFFKGGRSGLLTKEAAVESLVLDHGVFAGQARQMVTEAIRSNNWEKKYLIKRASDLYQEDTLVNESTQPGFTRKTATGPSITKVNTSSTAPMPGDVVQKATAAAETGIKAVFDTAALDGLVRNADVTELRKDFIVDIRRGMDRIGRMLFLFYWQNESFEDRYGPEDMQKLEDSLKQVFRTTGDLVLFLKDKMTYSVEESESIFGLLSEDTNESSGE